MAVLAVMGSVELLRQCHKMLKQRDEQRLGRKQVCGSAGCVLVTRRHPREEAGGMLGREEKAVCGSVQSSCVSVSNLHPRREMGRLLSRGEEEAANTKAQRLERCEKEELAQHG